MIPTNSTLIPLPVELIPPIPWNQPDQLESVGISFSTSAGEFSETPTDNTLERFVTTFPHRLITAQDYDTAPVHTVVEFDHRPGALGYLNWDHRWEISDDPHPHDHAAGSVAETEGASTVLRWGTADRIATHFED